MAEMMDVDCSADGGQYEVVLGRLVIGHKHSVGWMNRRFRL